MTRLSRLAAAGFGALAIAGCGGSDSPAENRAEALEEAAEYSTPAAAEVLENKADQLREQNVADPAAVQNALQAAGNAQVQSNGH